jgi:hypothetical protein
MIKFTLSLLFTFTIICTVCGQTVFAKSDTSGARKHDTLRCLKPRQLKLNFDDGGLALSFEQRTDSVNSLYFRAGLQPHVLLGVTLNGPTGDFVSQYSINPFATAGYRHYYNFKSRTKRKRNVANNSASFIAVDVGYQWQPYRAAQYADRNGVAMLQAAWGIQRCLGQHFSYELLLGVVASHEVSQNNPYQPGLQLEPVASFKIGYILF